MKKRPFPTPEKYDYTVTARFSLARTVNARVTDTRF